MTTIKEYISAVQAQGSHVGKVHQFLSALESIFKVKHSDYELESHVVSSTLQVRGRIDTVIGDVLLEFKTNLKKELADAEDQLRKYLSAFHEKNPVRPCIGIATDGVVFRVYRPVSWAGDSCTLQLLESQDLRKLSEDAAVLWLDKYLFRRTPKVPTEEDVSARFGTGSPTYRVAEASFRGWWERIKGEPGVRLKYEIWQQQLTIVYGEGLGNEQLFLQHTYLATVAKLLASIALKQPIGSIVDVLTGAHFEKSQIYNFVEEDLFFWPLHPDTGAEAAEFAERLLRQLGEYDPAAFTEDILKGLYQELVDPAVRHDLGEYYTPDWLAEEIVRRVIGENTHSRVLDPACGSGTFLFVSIRVVMERMLSEGASKSSVLEHISTSIFGIDVHPLAVLVARTNYVLACAPLLASRKGPFSLPVYLGDSLMYRSLAGTMDIPDIEIRVDKKTTLWFPERLRDDAALLDEVIRRTVHWATEGESGEKGFATDLETWKMTGADAKGLTKTFKTLKKLAESGRDSIWGYVVRNLARPHVLSRGEPFDLVIGNPPWLAQRYIKSSEYQDFVKTRMVAFGIKPKEAKYVAHLDLSALFYAECSYRYLRPGGLIAFVMPRGALRGRQYQEFLKLQFGGFTYVSPVEFWDLLGVKPLFNVPASVLICQREVPSAGEVPLIKYVGLLPRKNASWSEAQHHLEKDSAVWKRPTGPVKFSKYHDKFRQGATIVPQCFWFVRLEQTALGINPTSPAIRTDLQADAKKPWQDIELSGQVEAQFLWACALPEDMLPFVIRRLRPVVLPVALDKYGSPSLLGSADSKSRGHAYLGDWMEKAETYWKSRKTEKSPAELTARLNYNGELLAQFPPAGRYVVLFTKSATYLTAAMVDRDALGEFQVGDQSIEPTGLVADDTTYWYATDDLNEALYLVGWLNSPAVDDAIKEDQTMGLYGPRDIHRRPLELNLPKFDGGSAAHVEIADLAKVACEEATKVAKTLSYSSVGKLRAGVRQSKKMAGVRQALRGATLGLVPDL